MGLRHFYFNYEEGLKWFTKETGCKFDDSGNSDVDRIERAKLIDIPRVYYFPKSLKHENAGPYYFSGWENNKKSLYTQGDMDGGSFLQPFWTVFAIKHASTLEYSPSLLPFADLRFGYVNDENERCSVAIVYNSLDPSKYMVSVLKNAEKVDFKERTMDLFISDFFCENLQYARRIESTDLWSHIKKCLHSSSLEAELGAVFNEKGMVDVAKAEAFSNSHLKKYWKTENELLVQKEQIALSEEKQLALSEEKQSQVLPVGASPLMPARPAKSIVAVEQDRLVLLSSQVSFNLPEVASSISPISERASLYAYFPCAAGVAIGGGIGWVIGAYLVGPLLAPFTFGLSLFLAPVVFTLVGMLIGGVAGEYAGHHQENPPLNPVSDSQPQDKPTTDSSYGAMAKHGLKAAKVAEISPTDNPPLPSSALATQQPRLGKRMDPISHTNVRKTSHTRHKDSIPAATVR